MTSMTKRLAVLLTLLTAATFGLAGCGSSDDAGAGKAEETELTTARDDCAASADGDPEAFNEMFDVGDGGHTLIVHGAMTEDVAGLACILAAIKTPDSVISQMDTTTSMMGRQSADAGGYNYEWSYHPDNGINMTITD